MARNVDYNLNINDEGALQTLGQLEQRAAQLNEEIRGVSPSSQAFAALQSELQGVNSQLERANVNIEGFTERRRLQALQGAVNIFAGGIQTIQGFTVALGLSNEETEKVIQNLLAVQQTAQGIQTVTDGFITLREATRGLTTTQLGFNRAALANPYVLGAAVIVTAIASIVTQWDEFKDAFGDTSFLDDVGDLFNDFISIIGGFAAVIARQLGTTARGFVQLFQLDFDGALESFSDLFNLEGIQGSFNRGRAGGTSGNADSLSDETRNNLFTAVFGEGSIEELAEIAGIDPNDNVALFGLYGADIVPTETQAQNAIDAITAFNEQIAEVSENRDQRAIDSLRGAFGENVELQKALAIAEGAYQAGKSVTQTISSIRTITSTANAAAAAADSILPGSGIPIRAQGALNAGIEGALGAVDVASIVQNTNATIAALENGNVFNPGGSVDVQQVAGPTTSIPSAGPSEVPDSTAAGQGSGMVLLTPTSGPGSLQSTIAKDNRRASRRRLGG